MRLVWRDKDVSIEAMKFPDREKPALCIIEGTTATVYGYFRDDYSAETFMQKLAELFGVAMPDKYGEGDENK